MELRPIAVLLRAGQLFAHQAHHLVSGPSFFGDHGFFGDVYEAFEGAYDDVIEYSLASGDEVDLPAIGVDAADLASGIAESDDTDDLFAGQLSIEEKLQKLITKHVSAMDDAGQNLLQGLAQDSKKRIYKIQRRLGE